MSPARTCGRCGSWPCRCDAPDRALPRLHAVSESCVCGGPDIRAETGFESDIVAAIQRHQVEPRHIAWRAQQEIEPAAAIADAEERLARDLMRELVGGRR